MSMEIINNVPTYDNESEYDIAHADWCCTGAELSYEKDMYTPEDHRKLMAEHMALQPAMTEEVFFDYDPANMGTDLP